MAFKDKNEFEVGDREGRTAAQLPQDSLDDEMEELQTDPSEDESADNDELAEYTAADWRQQFPDLSVEELQEKIPDRTRSSWMVPVVSCLWGTLLGAAIAGLLIDQVPAPWQLRLFFVFFAVLAPLIAFAGHWFFVTRPSRIADKLEKEGVSGPGPIHPE